MGTGCCTKSTFISELKRDGVIVTEEEIDGLVEVGLLTIDGHGCIPFDDLYTVEVWVKAGRSAPLDLDARVDVKPHSSGLVGSSTDAGDRLYHLTIEKMGEGKLSYRDALIEAQKENPELARRVVQELDEFRGRNKPERLKR
jgi:hypothetical protein